MRNRASVYIQPREDGQYSDHATDVLALLAEAGVSAEYATDPMAGGVYGEKTADTFLPPLLIILSDGAAVINAIQGVVHVVRWFLRIAPGRRRVVLDVTFEKTDTTESRSLHIESDGSSVDDLERILREAAGLWSG